jgi:hypothetical protein
MPRQFDAPRAATRAPSPLTPAVDPLESPLAWLRRRKDKDGNPMISAAEFEAGERLRADFTFGQLMPSVTARWSPVGAGDGRPRSAGNSAADLTDNALAARERVHRALDAVGPELSGILVDVCWFLRGLEDAEKAQGWPLRSAKVVLQLSLQRLARHYGLMPKRADNGGSRSNRPRHWGADGYKPANLTGRESGRE